MVLTQQEVTHVAHLARLSLDANELELMRAQLSGILEYIELLQEVDVENIPPTTQVTGFTTVMRPDRVDAGLTRDQALANAPDQVEGMFRIKAVFET